MIHLCEPYPPEGPERIIRLCEPSVFKHYHTHPGDRIVAHLNEEKNILRVDRDVWNNLTSTERDRVIATRNTHTYVSQIVD